MCPRGAAGDGLREQPVAGSNRQPGRRQRGGQRGPADPFLTALTDAREQARAAGAGCNPAYRSEIRSSPRICRPGATSAPVAQRAIETGDGHVPGARRRLAVRLRGPGAADSAAAGRAPRRRWWSYAAAQFRPGRRPATRAPCWWSPAVTRRRRSARSARSRMVRSPGAAAIVGPMAFSTVPTVAGRHACRRRSIMSSGGSPSMTTRSCGSRATDISRSRRTSSRPSRRRRRMAEAGDATGGNAFARLHQGPNGQAESRRSSTPSPGR